MVMPQQTTYGASIVSALRMSIEHNTSKLQSELDRCRAMAQNLASMHDASLDYNRKLQSDNYILANYVSLVSRCPEHWDDAANLYEQAMEHSCEAEKQMAQMEDMMDKLQKLVGTVKPDDWCEAMWQQISPVIDMLTKQRAPEAMLTEQPAPEAPQVPLPKFTRFTAGLLGEALAATEQHFTARLEPAPEFGASWEDLAVWAY
mmetsp:Transcript_78947/g.218458  ORF Transcript_78947/g.218458 Transcript_78947/m.218458 type:complete len:203 (-) Transcript_78947:139-747(-)